MKNMWLMIWFTIREAMARKVFIAFFIISVLVILIALAIVSFMNPEAALNNAATESGKKLVTGEIVTALEIMFISPSTFLGLILSIFASASFVPVMLEKGNIDLLLSKPVSRAQLLLGKYFGGLLVVLLNLTFLITGIWLVISFKFAYWDAHFLYLILIITFAFAVLYAMIVLFGVLTKSSTAGMMTAYLIFIVLSPLLLFVKDKGKLFIENEFLNTIVKGVYYIIPKTSELLGNVAITLASGKAITDFQPVISSFLFLILMMALAVTMFNRKDF